MMEKLWGEGPGGACGSCPRREELQEDKWLHSQGWERWKIRHTALGRRGKQCWGAGQASPTLTTPRGNSEVPCHTWSPAVLHQGATNQEPPWQGISFACCGISGLSSLLLLILVELHYSQTLSPKVTSYLQKKG